MSWKSKLHQHSRSLGETVERAVASRHRPPSTMVIEIVAGVLLILIALIALGAVLPGWGWTAVVCGMAGLVAVALLVHGYRKRRCLLQIEQAHQLFRLARLSEAARILDRCLSRRSCPEPARVAGLVELGHICLAAGDPEHAEVALVAALQREEVLGPDWQYRAKIGLAEAKVRCQQLTDAAAVIGRLERQGLAEPWRSRLSVARCLQRLSMGRADDVVERLDDLYSDFRNHLGVEAGFGYGLLAAALDARGHAARAARLWADATTLIRPDRLVQRYPELDALAAKYGASEWPW